MCNGIVRSVVRLGVITAAIGAAGYVIAGPQRVHALVQQARHAVNDQIDRQIDDPTVLRAKLEKLRSELPERLDAFQADLESVRSELGELEFQHAVSERIVARADGDLDNLDGLLAQANSTSGIVRIRYQDNVMTTAEVEARAKQIGQLRQAHAARAENLAGELQILRAQEGRLQEAVTQLGVEQTKLESEIGLLNQKIVAFERNERLLTELKQQNARLDELGRYDAFSLDQWSRDLDAKRSRQEAEFSRLFGTDLERQYEDAAAREVERAFGDKTVIGTTERIIEKQADDCDDASDCDDDRAIEWGQLSRRAG